MSNATTLGALAGIRALYELMSSDELIVEVDVILPSTSTLHFAHDVGETIQCVLERQVIHVFLD